MEEGLEEGTTAVGVAAVEREVLLEDGINWGGMRKKNLIKPN